MKVRYFVLIVFALCFSIIIPNVSSWRAAANAAEFARAAVVDDLNGTVSATQDQSSFPAFRGLALLRDDGIGTGAASWSRVELAEGQFAVIEENTAIQIAELADGLTAGAGTTRVYMSEGKAWFDISNKTGSAGFEVKTPTCALTVRGTIFSVAVDKDGKTTLVVYEGIVAIRAEQDDGTAILDGGGNDVIVEAASGKVEIYFKDDMVSEVVVSGLSPEDLSPLVDGGGYAPGWDGPGWDGPGGVYTVLRGHMDENRREFMREIERQYERQLALNMPPAELAQVLELLNGGGAASPRTLLSDHSLSVMTEGDRLLTPIPGEASVTGSLSAGAGNDGTYSFNVNLGDGTITSAAMNGRYSSITYGLSGGSGTPGFAGSIINGNNFSVTGLTGNVSGPSGPYDNVSGEFGGTAARGFDSLGDIRATGDFAVTFDNMYGPGVVRGHIIDGRRVR